MTLTDAQIQALAAYFRFAYVGSGPGYEPIHDLLRQIDQYLAAREAA